MTGPIYRTATGPIWWYMRAFGFKGWTSLWNTIYLAPGIENELWLVTPQGIRLTQLDRMKCHEGMHNEQRIRYGNLGFMYRIVHGLVTVGYWLSPLENEARAAETVTRALELRALEGQERKQ
jgi:hypothetical protein